MKTSGACVLFCLLAVFLSPAEQKVIIKQFSWKTQDKQQKINLVNGKSFVQERPCRRQMTVPITFKSDWFPGMVNGQELESATGEVGTDSLISTSAAAVTPPVLLSPVQSDSETTTASSDCREEKFPCTRLYSVHKPVKQCISYLCVTSVRRMYIINKEVCTRVVCKENEVMQDEICRQLAGLPSRRLRRSERPLHLPCRQLLEHQRKRPDAL